MISVWLDKQTLPVFWLAEAKSYKSAVREHGGFAFKNSVPLFHGDMFMNVMPFSPWLVPVDSALAGISYHTLRQGLFLTSSATQEALVLHLRSLLMAGMGGEEVAFRFYDPNVLLPMLKVMDEDELNAFLGNMNTLTSFSAETYEIQTWSSTTVKPFELQLAPWWIIKKAHLNGEVNLNVVSSNLNAWLWRHFSDVMHERLDQGFDIGGHVSYELSKPDKPLTYRVLSAAFMVLFGALDRDDIQLFLHDHQDDEVSYALHLFTLQFKQKGVC